MAEPPTTSGDQQTTRVMPVSRGEPPVSTLKRHRAWLWVALAVVVLALIGAGTAWAVVANDHHAVPDVNGMSLQDATTTVQQAEFQVGSVTYLATTTGAPVGTVVAQSPAADAMASEGAKVDLTVVGPSSAPTIQQTTVPALTGMSQAQASAAISSARLQLGLVDQVFSATVPVGQVVSQAPLAGVVEPVGTTVTIATSQGPPPAPIPAPAVPDVVGETQSEAVETLSSAGYAASILHAQIIGVRPGFVASQSPVAGVLDEKGSTVTIVIATSPPSPSPSGSD